MRVVVELSKEEMESYKNLMRLGFGNSAMRKIINGTPLPEGHGALKDADKLAIAIAMMRDKCNYYGNEYEQALFQAYDFCVDEIIDTPTIIEADEEGAEK